jgi:hypothetical protein
MTGGCVVPHSQSLGVGAGGSAVEKRKLLLLPGMACQFLAIHPMTQSYYWGHPSYKKTTRIFHSFCSEVNKWCEMRAFIASNF